MRTDPHEHHDGPGQTFGEEARVAPPAPARQDSAAAAPGVPAYGVVRGRPLEQRVYPAPRTPPASTHAASAQAAGTQAAPHLHILLDGGTRQYDAAVNVFSKDRSEVLFRIAPDFVPARAADLLALPPGATPIGAGHADGLGLDYLRQHLVRRAEMTLLPVDPAHPADTLQNALGALVTSAIAAGADIFAFGSLYSDPGGGPSGANPFGLRPDAGVHNVHMNQGNPPGDHGQDNGTFQDGGLFVHFPGTSGGWTAVFIAFQSQAFTASDALA